MHGDCGDLPDIEDGLNQRDPLRWAGQQAGPAALRLTPAGVRRQIGRRPRMTAVVTSKAGAWIIKLSAAVSMSRGQEESMMAHSPQH